MEKEKLKILLVDDEKEFVESLPERLGLRDLKVDIAYDGEQALEAVKEEEPDLMVLDLSMPGIDGMEVLRRVKKKYPDVQVVILTGHGSDKDEAEAKRLGAAAYLEKPVDIGNLVGTLHTAQRKKNKSKRAVDRVIMAAAFDQAGEGEMARDTMAEFMEEKDEK